MPDSIQVLSARLVPQAGEIWEVIAPFRWQKYITTDHLVCETFTLRPGDKFLIRAVNQQNSPGVWATDNAEIMWFNEQGWCFLQNIPDYCARVNTWDDENE